MTMHQPRPLRLALSDREHGHYYFRRTTYSRRQAYIRMELLVGWGNFAIPTNLMHVDSGNGTKKRI